MFPGTDVPRLGFRSRVLVKDRVMVKLELRLRLVLGLLLGRGLDRLRLT